MIDPTERVAIVGIGGVFPGAPEPEAFWANVAAGFDATREVPEGRWALPREDAYDPRIGAPDRVYATRGGFVEGFAFDLKGLDLDPSLVDGLDPSALLALHAGRQAWGDAVTVGLDRTRVGVIFGNIVLPTEATSALAADVLGRTLAEQATGEAGPADGRFGPINRHAAGLPAGLLAQGLGLGGGAYTLDAACASSLYALKLAADELLSGRADAMITGGVSRPDPLYTQMGFAQLRALSPDGRAYPFDARGGGLVVGEGAGMFVLKRLGDAVRDGDHVYGVIAAVGLSNDVDGGLLAPSTEGQLRAMRGAYERAGWSPREVDLIECHATGTPVGDAVEFQSLRALWGEGARPGRCVIGSHKGNIGHALTASGAAGLIKVLLALKHETLPPTANWEGPSAKLEYAGGPFRVLPAAEPWDRPEGRPRRAAVSGFGFGGINAHALIEEWLPGRPEPADASVDPEREAEPAAVAIVGVGAHFGSFAGVRAYRDRVLGRVSSENPQPAKGDWGVSGSGWFRAEGLDRERAGGYHVEATRVGLGRFRIPPKELEEMLPQQSLALLAAADAIADAGWDDRPRLRAGVFLGIGLDPGTTNFHVRWTLKPRAREWNARLGLGMDEAGVERWSEALREASGPALTANRTMGALGGLVASRVAREFRLGGPSFTVSSEETSGLRALEIAVRLLRQGELDEAVVGGVDLSGDPRVEVAGRRAGIRGLVRGDGAAALVLKRLDDALADGDRIHGVIRGVGGSSAAGLDAATTDPGAWELARGRAREEAGEGIIGLELAAGGERQGMRDLAEVGHLGAASGLAVLVKGLVCLEEEMLPAKDGGDVGPRYWLRDRAEGPRRASVGASAVDGTCVSVVLEAYEGPGAALRPRRVSGSTRAGLFAIEGDDPAALRAGIDVLAGLVRENPGRSAEALARLWWRARSAGPSRKLGLAIVAQDEADLVAKLGDAGRTLAGDGRSPTRPGEPERFHHRAAPLGPEGKVALVFPGIGNHFGGMGRSLSAWWPGVFREMDRGTARLRSQLAPGSGWDEPGEPTFDDQRAPIMGQVVLGTAVTLVLRELGLKPDAVIGYSLGESAALFATGAWTDRDGMHARLEASPLFRSELAGRCEAARRAWGLKGNDPTDWSAGIVPYPAEKVREAMAGVPRVHLLIVNTPGEAVIGGRRTEVERVVARLGGRFWPLPVVSTVHCSIARSVEPAYRALHTLPTTPPPGLVYYSAGWGRSYVPDRETAADAVVAQAMDAVDFPRVIEQAYADGVRVFVEAGPGASCTRMIRATLGDRPHLARSACVAGEEAEATLLDLMGRLVAERVGVDLGALYDGDVDEDEADGNSETGRVLSVAVGGAPFATPERPRRIEPRSLPPGKGREASPTVTELEPKTKPMPTPTTEVAPRIAAVAVNGHHHTAPDHAPAPRTVPLPTASGPIVGPLVAAEASRGRAHEAFLEVSEGYAQAMTNHLAFQMALLEALMASPAGPAAAASPALEVHEGPRPVLDREACLEYAVGSIGKVLGEDFAAIDAYPTRVRLPDEPLMLVDRIMAIEGEALSMTSGRVVTEHDVLRGGWYLDGGRMPTAIAVESGQADLFLSGYLGIDFITKGLAVYRLLDAVVTFHRGLPEPGEVIRYDIRIAKFFRQGDTYLFRFHFDATIDGVPLMTMRDGCAGFFSEAELSAGKGIVHTALDLRPMAGKRPGDWKTLAAMGVESYDDHQIDALRRGDLGGAFGRTFAGLGLLDPIRLPQGKLTLVNRVPHLDPQGGRFGLGLIRSELDIHPDDWFLTCHFVDDQVMPGTLMYECCLHTLRVYLMRMGWIAEAEGVAFEPVPGVNSRLRCRGQVTASTKLAVFELAVKEVGYGPEPYAIADAMMYADGKAVVEVIDMSLRLTGLTREDVERLWEGRGEMHAAPVLFSREQVLAFALGKPSEAFGDRYKPFDEGRVIARLPAPPYSFLDRVTRIDGEAWVMQAPTSATAEYDVPPGEWYFGSNRQAQMPFAVLLEVPLQVCGWVSSYIGSVLTSDEDLAYRNLGGTGVLLAEVTDAIGTLTTHVTMTRVSHSAGMIIQHFDLETFAGETPVYRGTTYFGFFRREALLNQVGIREAAIYRPTSEELARAEAFDYPAGAPFPDDALRMVERVTTYLPDGGPTGLGFIEGTMPVDPGAWFFKAHFHQDPVVPGSLGLESFLQLLKVFAARRWGATPDAAFETIGLGEEHGWAYRGQVVPSDRLMTTQAVIVEVDDARRRVKADGFLSVDGRVIYQMTGFTLRMA